MANKPKKSSNYHDLYSETIKLFNSYKTKTKPQEQLGVALGLVVDLLKHYKSKELVEYSLDVFEARIKALLQEL